MSVHRNIFVKKKQSFFAKSLGEVMLKSSLQLF